MLVRPAGIGGFLALAIVLVAATSPAAAPAPAGPRIAFVKWDPRQKIADTSLQTIAAGGEQRRRLMVGDRLALGIGGISWSPDGTTIAFGAEAFRPRSDKKSQPETPSWVYLVDAGGGVPAAVPGTRNGSDPIFSPDGTRIAFSRYKEEFDFDPKDPLGFRAYQSTTTWIVDLASGESRQLTPWKNYEFADPSSFSPDGNVLALDRSRGAGPEAVAYRLDTGRIRVIRRGAENPSFSPDGKQIALVDYRDRIVVGEGEDRVSVGELYVVRADGSQPRRLTRSREWQESDPSWDPAGNRLAFIRSGARFAIGLTNVVMQVNADGTCPRRVVGQRRKEDPSGLRLVGPGLYAPTWQPGPGREAGPISC